MPSPKLQNVHQSPSSIPDNDYLWQTPNPQPPTTVTTADVIIGVENGSVVEKGTHEQLINNKGIYHELVANQVLSMFGVEKILTLRDIFW